MSDIVERLRDQGRDAFAKQYSLGMYKLCDEAAEEIERLRAEVERLRRTAGEPTDMSEWWMVWSNEHRAWWKPGGYGYTTATHKAGRFTRTQAEEIVAQANIILHDPPHEVMVLAPDADMLRNDMEAT